MPRAKDDRKPVGTEDCGDCGTTAAFYQVQTGKRRGYLYRRCACGADQSTGAEKQKRWLAGMARTASPMIEHPLNLEEPEPAEKPENTEAENSETPAAAKGSGGFVGLAVLAVGAIGALLIS